MTEFLNTGIDTEYLTLFLVIIGLIMTPILVLSVYHLQKLRPKIKIDRYHSNSYEDDIVNIIVHVKNIGYGMAENMNYEMTSMTKGITINHTIPYPTDLEFNRSWHPSAVVSIKTGEKCKIKIKISWDNHTFKLKKRNNLTQEFTCNRIEDQNIKFKKC